MSPGVARVSTTALSAGDWVEVRSKDEILRTLDKGQLEGLPFMPQMFKYCGQRFQVFQRAHKTCDTVNRTGGRRIANAVHLQGLRCDGAAYGGCDAACLIFWKEAWLKPVPGPSLVKGPARQVEASNSPPPKCSEQDVVNATRAPGSDEADPTYVCQATRLPQATEHLAWWDLRQYVEDYTSGNVDLRTIVEGALYVGYFSLVTQVGERFRGKATLIRLYDRFQSLRGGIPFPRRHGRVPPGQKTPTETLGLKPGDLVRVKSFEQIRDTLDGANKNRGLFFDAEEVPYCGQTHRVRSRVDRIVDERTGKLIKVLGNTVILEEAWCKGHYSDRRMFCPRAIYSFWRETWLERVDPAGGVVADHAEGGAE